MKQSHENTRIIIVINGQVTLKGTAIVHNCDICEHLFKWKANVNVNWSHVGHKIQSHKSTTQ